MDAIGALIGNIRDAIAGPLYSVLVLLFTQLAGLGIPSWGLTIIVFTVLVKVIFWPLTMQQMRASRAMQALQPQLADLKKQRDPVKDVIQVTTVGELVKLFGSGRVISLDLEWSSRGE